MGYIEQELAPKTEKQLHCALLMIFVILCNLCLGACSLAVFCVIRLNYFRSLFAFAKSLDSVIRIVCTSNTLLLIHSSGGRWGRGGGGGQLGVGLGGLLPGGS